MSRKLILRILVLLAGPISPIWSFFTYPPKSAYQQYPAPPVPRGYQPPPNPPLASDYYVNEAPAVQQNQYPRQAHRAGQWYEQNRQRHTQWSQNSQPQVLTQQQWPQQQANRQPIQEPVLINTIIQVYTNENAPNRLFSEVHTLTSVRNNERVEISRNTTLDTNYGILARQPSAGNYGNVAHVRAFAATNNTRISKAELEKELDRELEKAIPFILEKLDRSNETHRVFSDPAQATTTPPAITNLPGRPLDEDVTHEDIEKLIDAALSQISDNKVREKERAELEKARKLTESPPQTTLSTVSEKSRTQTVESTSQSTALNTKTAIHQSIPINTSLPTTDKQTTARLIVFERTTTPEAIAEESPIPEAESDAPDNEVYWITATPATGPEIVTQIVDLKPVQPSSPEVVEEQRGDVATVVTSPPITVFHRVSTTFSATLQREEEQTDAVNADKTSDTKSPSDAVTQHVPNPQFKTTPHQITNSHEETWRNLPTPQLTQQTEKPKPTIGQERTTSSSFVSGTETGESQTMTVPVLILKQEQTSMPTTQDNVPKVGATVELIVPHHALNVESSEIYPRIWKQRRGNHTLPTLQQVVSIATPVPNNNTKKSPGDSTLTTSGPEQIKVAASSLLATGKTQPNPVLNAQESITSLSLEVTPQTVNDPEKECPVPNNPNDLLRGDVLFLLDGSSSVSETRFESAKKLIYDTVKQFHNIGPNGIQISLIQFNTEPFLEFSFRAHDCITTLLEDIADTSRVNGTSNISRAIEKAAKFAYSKTRGDRADAANMIILITDGQSDEDVQVPLALIRKNNTTLLVIANIKAEPNEIASLARNADLDLFNLTDVNTRPLAHRLVTRIKDILGDKPASALTVAADINVFTASTDQMPSVEQEGEDDLDTLKTLTTDPITPLIQVNQDEAAAVEGTAQEIPPKVLPDSELPASYQDDNVQIQCLNDGVRTIFSIPESFAGTLSAKDQANVEGCFVDIPLVDPDSSTVREISLVIRSNSCGLNVISSNLPRGTNNSIVINLVHNKTLVTARDRSYVIQCFVPHPDLEQTLETRLDVENVMAISKMISLNAVPPVCEYTLRKDTPNGPILQTASIGQIIYHRWECNGSDGELRPGSENTFAEINSAYGLHVHDCWASNGTSHGYEIVNQNGCSADPSLLGEVTYANDRILAYVRSFVFAFVDINSLLFQCKLSLCLRDKDNCEGISPPVCKHSNFSELLLTRRARHNNAAFDAALTVDVETQRVDLTDSLRAEKRVYLPVSLKIGVLLIALLLGACLGMCCFFRQQRSVQNSPKRMISAVFNDELPIIVEEHQRCQKLHTAFQTN